MNRSQIDEALGKIHAFISNSHIVYTSGRHGSQYMNKDAIYPHTALTSQLCLEIAKRYETSGAEVVLAPALGGIILSQWVAFHLSQTTGKEVFGVYAERATEGDGFVLKRGYDEIVRGRKTLILEDVLTTGISVKRVVDLARKCGAEVIGVAALCNRGGITPKELSDVPRLESLIDVTFESFEEKDCPLCAKKVPINTQVGKGREYLSTRKG